MKGLFHILVALLLLLSVHSGWAAEPEQMAQADALMSSPSLDYAKAQQALQLYEGALQGSPALLSRLARTCFVLGDLAPAKEQRAFYEKGLTYAEKLLTQEPSGVAGHYWKALNLSGLAAVGSRMEGFKLLPQIMEELKRALVLDETYDAAGVHRVLGRIYFEAPAWPISVGDKKKSLHHLEAAVRLAPENSTNHLYLAETLLALGQKAQARPELAKAVQAKRHAINPQGLKQDHQEAQRLLEELKKDQ
jgi:tetratricopeptide (TPR) repeat protein